MNSTPRKWVLKPLSPLLQPSDLRTIAGPTLSDPPNLDHLDHPVLTSDLLVAPGQSTVVISSQQEDWSGELGVVFQQDGGSNSDEMFPSSPSSSSGSHCGFYSFVEDPTSPEAELNQAWMLSPQRRAHLATLKEDEGFKLQTYSSNRKPQSLFSESNEDLQYEAGLDNSFRVVQVEEERQLREDIIRSQAPKKKPAFRNLDLTRTPDHLVQGFSWSCSPGGSTPEPLWPPEPGTVDKEQINFDAAREQFLKAEQDQLETLSRSLRSSRTYLNTFMDPSDRPSSNRVETRLRLEGGRRWTLPRPAQDEMHPGRKPMGYQSRVFDDLDSGLEERPVNVGGVCTDDDVMLNNSQWNGSIRSEGGYETPIEREIRLIQEREEKLRLSRGLRPSSSSRVEMVEITTRRLQTPAKVKEKLHQEDWSTQEPQQTPAKAKEKLHQEDRSTQEPQQTPAKAKEKLHQEDRSTQEPQRQGHTLKDRKKDLGEHDEDKRPGEGPRMESGGDEVFLPPCCPHRHSAETELYISRRHSACQDQHTTDLEEQKPSSSPDLSSPPPPSWTPLHEVSSTTPQTWRESLLSTGLRSRGQGPPDFIKKEIQEDQRREQELRDLRASRVETDQQVSRPAPLVEQATSQSYPSGNKGIISMASPSPHLVGCLPSTSSVTTQHWTSSPPPPPASTYPASSPSSSSLPEWRPPPPPVRGLTEMLLQDFEERQAQLKLEESSYAGILPVDDVNNQVVESTRVIRHKNQRALRWEAGVFANQGCR